MAHKLWIQNSNAVLDLQGSLPILEPILEPISEPIEFHFLLPDFKSRGHPIRGCSVRYLTIPFL